jgi:DNA-binding transcriptional regulator YiaG
MPFCHLIRTQSKPKNNSYLWKSDKYPASPRHIGEQIKKRRFDLKMTAVKCCKILKIDKSTLFDWECGRHEPSDENRQKIVEFLMDAGQQQQHLGVELSGA